MQKACSFAFAIVNWCLFGFGALCRDTHGTKIGDNEEERKGSGKEETFVESRHGCPRLELA